jgi:glycosyltransferase involved in cell wall biosynthesis
MSATPKVSVIVPVREDAWLDEALASVAAQTLRDHEVIVVDDRLGGPSLERAGVRVVTSGGVGVCRARNLGLAAARGEYVCFFDGDDKMRPDLLAKTAARLDGDRELAFASFWVQLFGQADWTWQPASVGAPELLIECTVATAALARRAVVEAIGGFDAAFESGHEDWDLWLSLVAAGHRGALLSEVLFDYRRRTGSRSEVADQPAGHLAAFEALVRKHGALYRRHLPSLLSTRDRDLAERLARLWRWRDLAAPGDQQ